MSLTSEEKDNLLKIIEIIYGYDSQFESYKNDFNESTVLVVEKAITALIQCNDNMKTLVSGILGGSGFIAKGWLKKVIRALSKELKKNKIKFNGLACRSVAAGNWRSAIIISTY